MPKLIFLIVLAHLTAAVSVCQSPGRRPTRPEFLERMAADEKVYDRVALGQMEQRYVRTNDPKIFGTEEAKSIWIGILEKFPKSNRAGCSAMYLAQRSSGDERERYLKLAITEYSDAWYGDGVQVGAYARFHLAYYYTQTGRRKEAAELIKELLQRYPAAVTHDGEKIADLLAKTGLVL